MPARHNPDTALWQHATRDVRPLAPGARPTAAPRPAPEPAATRPAVPTPEPPRAPLDRFAGIDRANAERLKRGKHRIEARLDLHGMTQDEAHRALAGFIRGARSAE